MSAIATNGRVVGGGAYAVVSRSLGAEIGTAIGVLYFIASTMNITLNRCACV
jgi:amino acid transporter